MNTLLLIVVCVGWLTVSLSNMKRLTGRLRLVAPTTVFIGCIVARYGLGSVITLFTPKELVLPGEYGQYMVTWQYVEKTSALWVTYTTFAIVSMYTFEKLMRIYFKDLWSRDKGSIFHLFKEESKELLSMDISRLTIGLLVVFAIGSVLGMLTGSTDRGSTYIYWASQPFKPVSAFIALSRLSQLVFLLIPFTLRYTRTTWTRIAIVCLAMLIVLLGLISGGRGAVLYPVIMVWLGWILCGENRKKVLQFTIVLITSIIIAIPAIATFRDGPTMSTTNARDIVGRTKGFVTEFSLERFQYRVQALGREIYACSDAFLFLDKNATLRKGGFGDITPSLVAKILIPRYVSSDRHFDKFDGSTIAKKSMGVVNDTWFPCITTPADLWRRGGYISVGIGGLLIGLTIGILQAGWVWLGTRRAGISQVLLVLLPATYIQSGIYGTLREVAWQLGWELPKYIVIIIVLGLLVMVVRRLRSIYNECG